jgi:hypothetical protein
MKYLIALFLVGCSNSSADIVPKIPDMYCNKIGEVDVRFSVYKCEDKDSICYVTHNGQAMECFKKEAGK